MEKISNNEDRKRQIYKKAKKIINGELQKISLMLMVHDLSAQCYDMGTKYSGIFPEHSAKLQKITEFIDEVRENENIPDGLRFFSYKPDGQESIYGFTSDISYKARDFINTGFVESDDIREKAGEICQILKKFLLIL